MELYKTYVKNYGALVDEFLPRWEDLEEGAKVDWSTHSKYIKFLIEWCIAGKKNGESLEGQVPDPHQQAYQLLMLRIQTFESLPPVGNCSAIPFWSRIYSEYIGLFTNNNTHMYS